MIVASLESRTVSEVVLRIPAEQRQGLHDELSDLLCWNAQGGHVTYCPLVVELCDAIGDAGEPFA